jgi:hypothetical protein
MSAVMITGRRRRLAGALLVTAGLMLFAYAIVGTTRYGWDSARTFLAAALAVRFLQRS